MKVYNPDEDVSPVIPAKTARYYTPKEVADILRVPMSWVYERTRLGQIPMRKFGRLVRIPVDEFEVWEKEQTARRA